MKTDYFILLILSALFIGCQSKTDNFNEALAVGDYNSAYKILNELKMNDKEFPGVISIIFTTLESKWQVIPDFHYFELFKYYQNTVTGTPLNNSFRGSGNLKSILRSIVLNKQYNATPLVYTIEGEKRKYNDMVFFLPGGNLENARIYYLENRVDQAFNLESTGYWQITDDYLLLIHYNEYKEDIYLRYNSMEFLEVVTVFFEADKKSESTFNGLYQINRR